MHPLTQSYNTQSVLLLVLDLLTEFGSTYTDMLKYAPTDYAA